MSPTRLPGRAWAMPAASASRPASSRRCACSRDVADGEGEGAVGDVAVQRDADVDRDQVAVRDLVGARDPVHDHVVRRDADRLRVAAVALRRGDAAERADVLVGDPVELAGRDPRLDLLADVRDRLGDDAARGGHLRDLLRRLADDHLAPTVSKALCDLREDVLDGPAGVQRARACPSSGSTRPPARSARGRSPAGARSSPACRRSGPPRARGRAPATSPSRRRGRRRRSRRARGRSRAASRRAPRPARGCAGSRRG